jgi:hypothetical protein
MSPFDWLNSINYDKKNLMDEDPTTEKLYSPFMINRGLSYFPDTILYANQMNGFFGLENKLQYEFYLYGIQKRKRFSKWTKKDKTTDTLDIIVQYYKYNEERALEALSLLTDEQIELIKQKMYKGGVND